MKQEKHKAYRTAMHLRTEIGPAVALDKKRFCSPFLFFFELELKVDIGRSSSYQSLLARGKSVEMFDTRSSIETSFVFARKRIYEKKREKFLLSSFFRGCSPSPLTKLSGHISMESSFIAKTP